MQIVLINVVVAVLLDKFVTDEDKGGGDKDGSSQATARSQSAGSGDEGASQHSIASAAANRTPAGPKAQARSRPTGELHADVAMLNEKVDRLSDQMERLLALMGASADGHGGINGGRVLSSAGGASAPLWASPAPVAVCSWWGRGEDRDKVAHV